jgi:hypothetical protein
MNRKGGRIQVISQLRTAQPHVITMNILPDRVDQGMDGTNQKMDIRDVGEEARRQDARR